MRAYECMISNEAKAALGDYLLDRLPGIKIRRLRGLDGVVEDWSEDRAFCRSWLRLIQERDCWRLTFGGGALFRDTLCDFVLNRPGCRWVWPFGSTDSRSEIHLSDDPDTFGSYAGRVHAALGGQWTTQLDGLDESYWDLRVGETVVTVHRQHFLGVSVFADPSDAATRLLDRLRLKLLRREV